MACVVEDDVLLQLLEVGRLVLGIALVLVATFDFVVTALTVGGRAGPISIRLADALHRVAGRRDLRRHPRVGWLLGPALLLAIFLFWLFAISLGWSMVFATEGALTAPEDTVLRLIDPFEFVFGTLLGRGGGVQIDTSQPLWTSLEVVLGLMGVAFVTLSLAWVLPVVSGVATRREVAAKMASMGTDAQDVLLSAWDGQGFGNLDLHLHTLTSDLAALAQRHLAYPAIHYFHSGDWRTALGGRLAVVDDAVSLLALLGERSSSVPWSSIVSVRRAIGDYLDAIDEAFLHRTAEPPPPPAVDRLRAAGLLELSDDEVAARFAAIDRRRGRLHAYVEHDGWSWEDAVRSERDRDLDLGLAELAPTDDVVTAPRG